MYYYMRNQHVGRRISALDTTEWLEDWGRWNLPLPVIQGECICWTCPYDQNTQIYAFGRELDEGELSDP